LVFFAAVTLTYNAAWLRDGSDRYRHRNSFAEAGPDNTRAIRTA
jgi:hypothetical protein